MPLKIADLCEHLNNQTPNFAAPDAGQNIPVDAAAPFLNLGVGTRKLILIADTFHDFKNVDKLSGMPGEKPKPGSELLKAWAIEILTPLGLPNLTTAEGETFTLIEFVNLIYTHPEEFVFTYLYYNDDINVISSNDMYDEEAHPGAGPPAGTNTNFIIFPFPELSPGCPEGHPIAFTSPASRENSKTSAKKLYNFFKEKQNASTWATNASLPGYNVDIDSLRTLWWSWDQGSASNIFQDYDIEPNGSAGDTDVETNWWQWFGYAAQYDRVEMTDPKVNKLFINKLHPGTAVDLRITLPAGDGIMGVNSLALNADYFTWREITPGGPVDTSIRYELEERKNLKKLLANAIGYLSQTPTLNIGKLFMDIFAILHNVANMINQLIPNVVKYNASGDPLGIDAAGRNWDNIISIFTDFKRIGDYMQAKELYAIQPLKNMNIPLQTHDAILAAISNKIFNNYTVWQKRGTVKRCGVYILMLPFDNANGVSIPLEPLQPSVASQPLNGGIMTNNISFILDLLREGEAGGIRPAFWGGNKKREGKKKGGGKGSKSPAVSPLLENIYQAPQQQLELPQLDEREQSHNEPLYKLPPSRQGRARRHDPMGTRPKVRGRVATLPKVRGYIPTGHDGYDYFKAKIYEIFTVKNKTLINELDKYYKELEEIVKNNPMNNDAKFRMFWIKKIAHDPELINFVISYTNQKSIRIDGGRILDPHYDDVNANWLFNMITDFFISNYIIPVNDGKALDRMLMTNQPENGYFMDVMRSGGKIKSEILGKIVKYIEQIKIIKENIKKLNKNKKKNKDIITIKKKLIEKILIKIKKEKEKEKQKIKKEREKEKQKIKKEREKEKQKIKKEREKEKIKKEKEIKKKDKLKKNKN